MNRRSIVVKDTREPVKVVVRGTRVKLLVV